MADSSCSLVRELFVLVLDLVDYLSRAAGEQDAIKLYGLEQARCWARVSKVLAELDEGSLSGRDLREAVSTIAQVHEGTETQCNTFPEVAVYIFNRLKPLKEAARLGWTAAKQGGTVPDDPFPVDVPVSSTCEESSENGPANKPSVPNEPSQDSESVHATPGQPSVITLADLDKAVRASSDNLDLVQEWPAVRHILRQQFGDRHSDAGLWQRFKDYMQACRMRPDWYLKFPVSCLQHVLDTAASKEGTVEIPLEFGPDGSARIPEWAVEAYGLLLDQINLGPAPGFGNKFPISTFDAKTDVVGDPPTICPKADRKPPVEFLPMILGVYQRHGMVKQGHTIHWWGSQSRMETVCTCFPSVGNSVEQSAGIAEADDARKANASKPPNGGEHTHGTVGTPEEYGGNFERDRWLHENRPKMILAELEQKLDDVAKKKAWTSIGKEAIRDATAHYADFFSLPRAHGPVGRPPKQKKKPGE